LGKDNAFMLKIPINITALTAQWLSKALRDREVIKNTDVQSFTTEALGDKGITSQLARLRLSYPSEVTENAPRTIILKLSLANPERRQIVKSLGMYKKEVNFYDQISNKIPLRTPRCYYSDYSAESGEHILLLEDLAPARNGNRFKGCTALEAELAVREIAIFHAFWWEHPQLDLMDWLGERISSRPSKGSLRRNWEPFLRKVGDTLPVEIMAIGNKLIENRSNIVQYLEDPPRTLIHGDYKLDNMFFASAHGGVPFAVIDWQRTSRWRGIYDIACFLCNNVDPELRRAKESAIIRMYHKILIKYGIQNYSFDQLYYDYRISILEYLARFANGIGAGVFDNQLEQVRNTTLYRTCQAALDLKLWDLLPI
jgi:hypothetical protein